MIPYLRRDLHGHLDAHQREADRQARAWVERELVRELRPDAMTDAEWCAMREHVVHLQRSYPLIISV